MTAGLPVVSALPLPYGGVDRWPALAPHAQAAQAELPELQLEPVEALICAWLDAAQARFGAQALGVLDLPGVGTGRVEPAQLSLAAAAWWLMSMDQAGLPSLVELLATGAARGTLDLNLDTATAAHLVRFHREADEHFTADERAALWQRLFGLGLPAGQEHPFRPALGSLLQALSEAGRAPAQQGLAHLQARVAVAALDVASFLTGQAVGITGFAVQDLARRVGEAVTLLRSRSLSTALGGGALPALVARTAPRLLPHPVPWMTAVARAEAGRSLIQWLAAQGRGLSSAQVQLRPDDPVFSAAERLLAAGTGVT